MALEQPTRRDALETGVFTLAGLLIPKRHEHLVETVDPSSDEDVILGKEEASHDERIAAAERYASKDPHGFLRTLDRLARRPKDRKDDLAFVVDVATHEDIPLIRYVETHFAVRLARGNRAKASSTFAAHAQEDCPLDRIYVAETLGLLGSRYSLDTLTTMLGDRKELVQVSAVDALRRVAQKRPIARKDVTKELVKLVKGLPDEQGPGETRSIHILEHGLYALRVLGYSGNDLAKLVEEKSGVSKRWAGRINQMGYERSHEPPKKPFAAAYNILFGKDSKFDPTREIPVEKGEYQARMRRELKSLRAKDPKAYLMVQALVSRIEFNSSGLSGINPTGRVSLSQDVVRGWNKSHEFSTALIHESGHRLALLVGVKDNEHLGEEHAELPAAIYRAKASGKSRGAIGSITWGINHLVEGKHWTRPQHAYSR